MSDVDVWIVGQSGHGYTMLCQAESCDDCPMASNCWQVGGAS